MRTSRWRGRGDDPRNAAQKPQKPIPRRQAKHEPSSRKIQTLVRVADAAMRASPPRGFPDPVPERFPEGSRDPRLGADHPDARSGEDAERRADAATSGHAARHDRAARGLAAAAAPDKNAKDNDKDEEGQKAAPDRPRRRATEYPFEDVSFLDLKPAAPGQPLRIQRGIGVPRRQLRPLYRPARATGRDRPQPGGCPGGTAVLKQPLDVPNYGDGEF